MVTFVRSSWRAAIGVVPCILVLYQGSLSSSHIHYGPFLTRVA